MICGRCKGVLIDGMAVCPACGMATSTQPEADLDASRQRLSNAGFTTGGGTPRRSTLRGIPIAVMVVIGVVLIAVIASASIKRGDIPNGIYTCDYGDNIMMRGNTIEINGNVMRMHHMYHAEYTVSGTYEVSGGSLIWKTEDLLLIQWSFYNDGEYIYMDYYTDGTDIWLDGVQFKRQ